MSSPTSAPTGRSILIVGASRGLGYAMAAEFAGRGWRVLGTVRAPGTPLHSLAAERPGMVEIETLDMTDHDQIRAVRDRLSGRQFDIVFVNGGIANRTPEATMAEVSTEEFVHVMVTNVLGVMRAVEAFGVLARPGGVIGVMSSGQGSIANNANGTNDVYRASKAALNQAMASYAGRHADEGPRASPDGARLDPHGDGRFERAIRCRRSHAANRRCPHRAAGRGRPALP